jgi:hypothetical protein
VLHQAGRAANKVFLFDLEAICEMDTIVADCAWRAARKLWEDRIVGLPSVFVRDMQQVAKCRHWWGHSISSTACAWCRVLNTKCA